MASADMGEVLSLRTEARRHFEADCGELCRDGTADGGVIDIAVVRTVEVDCRRGVRRRGGHEGLGLFGVALVQLVERAWEPVDAGRRHDGGRD